MVVLHSETVIRGHWERSIAATLQRPRFPCSIATKKQRPALSATKYSDDSATKTPPVSLRSLSFLSSRKTLPISIVLGSPVAKKPLTTATLPSLTSTPKRSSVETLSAIGRSFHSLTSSHKLVPKAPVLTITTNTRLLSLLIIFSSSRLSNMRSGLATCPMCT